MEEERESVRGEEGGKGERGKWGPKGGRLSVPLLRRCCATWWRPPGIARAPADLAGAPVPL